MRPRLLSYSAATVDTIVSARMPELPSPNNVGIRGSYGRKAKAKRVSLADTAMYCLPRTEYVIGGL